jgi:chondroitin 4-sulfotransferase 11
MISDQYRFIFVHIRKTGGTSIEKVFEPTADATDVRHKHASLENYRKSYPRAFRRYFKFGFVRNPWDWLVSRYHWSRDTQHLFDFPFAEMLRRIERREPLSAEASWLETGALLPQWSRLAVRGAIAVDFVGRYERLQQDFDVVCDRIGHPRAGLPHVFATRHGHYTEYYDDAARAIVARVYAADIAAFDYHFGE